MEVLNFITSYGIYAVFFLILIEYACFPIPSEIVLPLTGYFAFTNDYNFFLILLMSIFAGYLGSLICYYVGYYGGFKIITSLEHKFPKTIKGIEYSKEKFLKYSNVSVFVCRLVPLCRTYISLVAGSFKHKILNFTVFSILGIILWNSLLITLGYYLGNKWNLVEEYYFQYKVLILFLFLTIVLIIFSRFIFLKIKNKSNKLYKK